jgi:16S rRNA (cytosine1402-N4)-methyltransferase
LDRLDRAELARIFSQWGEERYAWRIAGRVVESRPIRTTHELYDVVESALPRPVRWQAARSAARIFQALRIAVNDELAAVQAALPQALRCLAAGGRLVVISFHSLEDRIVKHFLREKAQRGEVELVTRKPLCASDAEVERNPRAHSAKLRACRKLRD